MIGRRAFIVQGSTLLATIPTVAAFLPAVSATSAPHSSEAVSAHDPIEFRIAGWSQSDSDASNENEVWLRMNQSWRVAWR
jgi:hypothetical protein